MDTAKQLTIKKFKEEKYVCRFTCFEPRDLHLLDVRAGETREVLTIKIVE